MELFQRTSGEPPKTVKNRQNRQMHKTLEIRLKNSLGHVPPRTVKTVKTVKNRHPYRQEPPKPSSVPSKPSKPSKTIIRTPDATIMLLNYLGFQIH